MNRCFASCCFLNAITIVYCALMNWKPLLLHYFACLVSGLVFLRKKETKTALLMEGGIGLLHVHALWDCLFSIPGIVCMLNDYFRKLLYC